ncbi:MAG: hypothetical protein M3P30_14580 [Chloroflexota bacterium]|nr:hypothetical protein [Chloroflexota bacterium]
MAYETARYAERRRRLETAGGRTDFWRNFGKWTVASLFFLAMLALLASLQLFQVTSEGASKRTLRRAVAALTEIDPLIDRQYDDLQQHASTAGADETVRLNDYPIDIPLRVAEVRGATKDQLRNLLLDRSADLMYSQGTSPLRTSNGRTQSVGRFSVGGITDDGLGFLRRRHHDILGPLTFALAVLCLVLGVTLAVLCRGFGRLASVGGVVLMASIPLVLAGIGARFYLRIASQGDREYIQREFLEIGQGLAWIPIRDGIAFTALGAVFLAIGVGCAVWADRRKLAGAPSGRPARD